MASAPVGEIPVLITGDWSELQTAIDQAASAAEAGSQKISAAFSSTAGDQIAQEFNQVTQTVTGFDAAVSSSTESFGTLGDYLNSLDAEGGAAADSLKDVEAATAGVGATTATASGAVSELPPRLHEVAEESGNASEELLGMAKSLAQIAEGLVIIEGLRELAQEALEVYGSVQKAEISLTALTGSAEVATEMIEGLKNVALSNALSFEQLVSASQRMTALGFSTEETRKTLQSAADAAAATGTSLDRVTNAIDRMALSGAAGGRQLAALGISTDTLAKSMGVAAGDVTTAFKALDQSERIAILNDALTKFSGVAGQVAQGVLGQWQNLKTQWEFVMEGIGAALAPIATQLITFAADAAKIIKELVDAFNTLPGPVKDVVVVVGLLAAAGPPVLLALSGIAKSAGLLFEVMAPLKLAFTDAAAYIGGMEGPLTLGTTRLLALGEAAGLAAAAFVGFELGAWAYKQIPGMKALGDSIASFILMVPGVQEAIDHFNGVSAAETSLLDATTKLNDKLALTGNEVIRGVNESLLSFSDRVLAAKKSVEDLTGVHGGLTAAQRELAKAIADVQKTWSDQTLAVINAKANLEAVTIAYRAGTATLGQYQAALDALERAQVAVNPNFVTSKERTKELDDATKALNSSQTAMADLLRSEAVPALESLASAQNNLKSAQSNYDASLATLQQAQISLNDAVALGTKGYALQGPAIEALKTAETNAKSAKDELASAQKSLTQAQTEAAKISKEQQTTDTDYATMLSTLGRSALTGYSEAVEHLTAAKSAYVNAVSTEVTIQAQLDELAASGKQGTTDYKDAELALSAAHQQVTIDQKNLSAAQSDANTINKDLVAASKALESAQTSLDTLYKQNLTPDTKDLSQALTALRDAKRDTAAAADALKDAIQDELDVFADETSNVTDLTEATQDVITAKQDLTDREKVLQTAVQELTGNFKVSKQALDDVTDSAKKLSFAAQNTQAALDSMGIQSAQSLQTLSDKATQSFNIISTSGVASANQVRDAQIKALQDLKAAYIANGTDLSSAQQHTLDTLLNQQSAFNQAHVDQWHTLYLNIDSQIMGLSDRLIQDLFEGKGSFGKTALKALEDIGAAVTSAFIAPAVKAIASFIAGALSDLASKLGELIKGFFDLGTTAVDAAKQIDTAIGGMAQGVGGVAGAGAEAGTGGAADAIGAVTSGIMGSISSIVSMVTGAISAITGIIGIFQNMHQETSLNAIEHNTRYSMMYLGERSDGGILGILFKINEELAFGTITKKIEMMANDIEAIGKPFWSYGLKDLDAIKDQTYWAMKKLDDIDSKTGKNTSGTVNVGGTDMGAVITGLQNINTTLQFDVGLSPWFQTAFQNINNGIVACAGWLQGIAGILQAGISTTGSNNTTTGLGALASYVGQNFTALENWLFNALGKTMALPALPGAIALPAALGGPTTNPGTTIVINNTVNGSVVGQNGMNQFANGIGDMLVNKLRSSGMKY